MTGYYSDDTMYDVDNFLMHYGVKGMKWKNHKKKIKKALKNLLNKGYRKFTGTKIGRAAYDLANGGYKIRKNKRETKKDYEDFDKQVKRWTKFGKIEWNAAPTLEEKRQIEANNSRAEATNQYYLDQMAKEMRKANQKAAKYEQAYKNRKLFK